MILLLAKTLNDISNKLIICLFIFFKNKFGSWITSRKSVSLFGFLWRDVYLLFIDFLLRVIIYKIVIFDIK